MSTLLLLNLTEYMCSTCTVQIPLIYCPYVWAVTCKLKCSLLNITFQSLNALDRVFCAFINNFKIFVGSEKKLESSLKEGCSGALISATVNIHSQAQLAIKVFENFKKGKDSENNEQLVKVRSVFDSFNLIEGLHTLYAQKKPIYKNILPPLRLLNEKDKTKLFGELEKLNFNIAA